MKPVQQKMKTFNFLVSGFLALEERCPLENAITLSCYPSSFILDIDYSVVDSLAESYSSCQNLEDYSNNRVIQADLGIQITFRFKFLTTRSTHVPFGTVLIIVLSARNWLTTHPV